MTVGSYIELVSGNVRRFKRHLLLGGTGIVVGTALMLFFLSLSQGMQENVLNRLYPVNQPQFQVETVKVLGLGIDVPTRIDEALLQALGELPGVRRVYPKQRSRFQAKLWGGGEIFGYEARLEAFFDGVDPSLVADELKQNEEEVLGEATCDGGSTCRAHAFHSRFVDNGAIADCSVDAQCPPGTVCRDSECRRVCPCRAGFRCVDGGCVKLCNVDSDCLPGQACEERTCRRLRCELQSARDQFSHDWQVLRGRIVRGPERLLGRPCPGNTYCAARNVRSREGVCEPPIPVVLSPFLHEVYNRVAATALGLEKLSGPEVMLGVRFTMLFGESYFVADEEMSRRVSRRCEIVGFSNKAMEFGVTMPLPVVARANALERGRESAASFTSVVVETRRNEDVPAVIDAAHVLGLSLSPKSKEGRKAANVLLVVTLVFVGLSLVIMGIAAVNIAHTLMMLVAERRTEIAVYRAVGASLWDIRAVVMGEAGALGAFAGAIGVVVGVFLGTGVEAGLGHWISRSVGESPQLLSYSWWMFVVAWGCALAFSLLGSVAPARGAARTDPVRVLAEQ